MTPANSKNSNYKTQRIDALIDNILSDIKEDITETRNTCRRIEDSLAPKVDLNTTRTISNAARITLITKIVFALLTASLAGGGLGYIAVDKINKNIQQLEIVE